MLKKKYFTFAVRNADKELLSSLNIKGFSIMKQLQTKVEIQVSHEMMFIYKKDA